MLIKLSYMELLQIASALTTIESVYGTTAVTPLREKVEKAMEYMDNAPITDIYTDLFGCGDSST